MHALLKISRTNWGNAHKSMLADTYILGHCIPTTWYARVKKKKEFVRPTHSKLLIIINYYTPCRFQFCHCNAAMRRPSVACMEYFSSLFFISQVLLQYTELAFCVESNKHYCSHCNNTVSRSSELYLCSCHDLQQPRGVHPAHEYNHQQCEDGGRVARAKKRIWNRQKSCPEAVVHQEEEAEKNIHRLTLTNLFIPPPAPRSKRHNFS